MVHGLKSLRVINSLCLIDGSSRRVLGGGLAIFFMFIMMGLFGCLTNVGVERRSGFIRDRDVEVSQLVTRGVNELQQGRNADAVESFKKALVLAPRSTPILNNLVVALMRAEEFTEAGERVSELESLEGMSAKSLFIKGDIAYALGDLDGAAGFYLRSVALIGREKTRSVNQGGDGAGEASGLSEEAKHSEVYKRLVEVKFKQGAVQEALRLMQDAEYHILKGGGRDEEEIARAILFAKIALRAGRFNDSVTVFNSVFEAGNRDGELLKLAAAAEYYLGNRLKFSALISLLVEGEELNEDILESFIGKVDESNESAGNSDSNVLSGEDVLERISQFRLQSENPAEKTEEAYQVRVQDFDQAAEIVLRYLISAMPSGSQVFLPPQAVSKYSDLLKRVDENLGIGEELKEH